MITTKDHDDFLVARALRSNLAIGKPSFASSTDDATNRPARMAFDGNTSTRWSSAYADEQWIYVDLGSVQPVTNVVLQWDTAYALMFQIQTSNDQSTWTTVYSNYNGKGGTNTIPLSVSARYVKMYAWQRATQWGYSLWEMEVWNSATNGTADPIKVLDYLKSISGSRTVIGMHNREPNSSPALQTNKVYSITGRWPALWSGDLLFSSDDVSNRWTMVYEALNQWKSGSIVHIMMHVVPPTQSEPGNWNGGVVSRLSDAQWNDLITNGGTLNRAWKMRLDNYAQYFQFLKDNGVQLLFRPFHEMNQGIFWWGGRTGSSGTAALYRLTRDYLVNTKGLTNLIWVWNMQDLDLNWSVYNPGNSYWDIFSLDVYNGDGFTTQKYNTAVNVASGKPMAIGECSTLPTSNQLASQQRWIFVMSWAELTFSSNTNAQIQALYGASNVITKDKLPKFN
jgi:hypothetical protein